MSNQDSSRDLSLYQNDYPRIIQKLLRLGLPITIIATIITLLIGISTSKDSSVKINIPGADFRDKVIQIDGKNLRVDKEYGDKLSKDLAIFSDGTSFSGTGYISADGKKVEDISEVPLYSNVFQIDDERAFTMSFNVDSDMYSIYLFTRSDYPKYTIQKLGDLVDFATNNTRMDFFSENGVDSVLVAGSYKQEHGLLKIDINTGELIPKVLIPGNVANFACNDTGDLYYITSSVDEPSKLVYGIVENGIFNPIKSQIMEPLNFEGRVLTHALEVTKEGKLKLIYDNNQTSKNSSFEDFQVITFDRNLNRTDGPTIAYLAGDIEQDPKGASPYMTNP